MANDALVLPVSTRPPISVLVQTDLDEQLYEGKLWQRNVSLQLFAGVNGFKSSYYGIGTPKVDGIQPKPNEMFISGIGAERARSLNTVGADVFQPLIKIRPIDPNITRHTSFYDNNAVMSDWSANTLPQTMVRPVARWVYSALEVVIAKDEEFWMNSGGAVPKLSLATETARDRQSTLMDAVDADWHLSTGPSSVNSNYWSAPYSFQIACDASSVYLGLDRSDDTYAAWRGNYSTAATPANFNDIYKADNLSTSTSGWASGVAPQLDKFGMRVRYYLVGGDLFSKAQTEAEKRGAKPMTMSDIPQMAAYGFKETGAVSINNQAWIIHDPRMPSGHVFGCNPAVWSVGFKKNFQMTTLEDQSRIRGQPRIKSAQMEVLYLGPICHAPWVNTYRTNVG